MLTKIEEILKEYNIDYVTGGKNVSKNNIGINCPFCGDDDSYHLGIFPSGAYYCWREPSHKGYITSLLSYLLNISLKDAQLLVGKKPSPYKEEVRTTICGGKEFIELPENFRKIENNMVTGVFYKYLTGRGFDRVEELIERYNIKCCISGKWIDRVIIPLYMNRKLMSWVGRSVLPNAFMRYRDLEVLDSVRHPKYCLFDYDALLGGDRLYVFEGMFDAMKLYWNSSDGISSTCLFTLNITDEQVKLLLRVSEKYRKVILLLDQGAELQAMKLLSKLSFLPNLSVQFIPDEFKNGKDVGDMNKDEIQKLIIGG